MVLKHRNVIDGSLVLTETIIENKKESKRNNCGAFIIRLSDVLNIKGNKNTYLDENDIFNIVNFKEECALDYGNIPRKYII